MSFQKVEAGRGIEWLKQSVALVLKNPAAFLVMALILSIIGIIPILGLLVLLIIGPALMAGMIYAYREEDQGRKAEIGMLFKAFQEPGKIGPLIALCIPGVIAMVLLIVFGFVLLGGALLGMGASGAAQSSAGLAASLGGGFVIFFLLCLAIVFVFYALIIFAIPRVMFDGVEPFAAMKESIAASLANIAPLFLYGIIMFVIVLVAGFILAFIPILGPLLLGLALNAINGAASYIAYRDVFAGGGMVAPLPPSPPVA